MSFGYRTTAAEVLQGADVAGKTVVITGALSGLGLETARAFVGAGAKVVLAVRRPAAAEGVEGIEGAEARALDLADQSSIRAFAAAFRGPLHFLICNAGVMATPQTPVQPQGYDLQLAVNHLGHFLLVNLLAEALLLSAPARVVMLSSAGHKRLQASGRAINWDDLHFASTPYDPFTAYAQSKAANIMFASEFSRKVAGSGVIAVSCHPGPIMTALQRHMDPADLRARGWVGEDGEANPNFKTPEQGASTTCFGCVAPELTGGEYLADCAVAAANSSTLSSGEPDAYQGVLDAALDADDAARLWRESEVMVGQTFDFSDLLLRTQAFVAAEAGAPFQLVDAVLPPLRPTEVQVELICTGLCASDIMCWKIAGSHPVYKAPLTPGHEGVGVVTKVGAGVTHLAVGARVGLGVSRGSCGTCEQCRHGRDNLCAQRRLMFANHAVGTFSRAMNIDARYAFPLPAEISDEQAGPLLCAGVTVYSPMVEHGIGAGHRVGVVGIGGLGHLALQFAKGRGCEVTAFSSSRSKEEEARGLGAHHFVATAEEGAWESVAGSLDFVLATTSGPHVNWPALLAALRPNGKIVIMGIAMSTISATDMALISGQKAVVGSAAGASHVIEDMLRFCVLQDIRPVCEVFPFAEVNEVIAKVAANTVRYRAVLQHQH